MKLATYVSFATEEKFLGAVVVAEPNFEKALRLIKWLKLDPGGEAVMFSVPPGKYPTNRLLSLEEIKSLGGRRLGDMSIDERKNVERNCVHLSDDIR